MAPLLLWCIFAALSCASALPLVPESQPQPWYAPPWYSPPEVQQDALPDQSTLLRVWDLLRAGEQQEAVTPSAPQVKRGNYMALCHFKICNMGRKRSLRPDLA